jgi:hypothetical protein
LRFHERKLALTEKQTSYGLDMFAPPPRNAYPINNKYCSSVVSVPSIDIAREGETGITN